MKALIFCAICTSIAGAAHVSAQQAYPAYPQLPQPQSMQPYGFPQQPWLPQPPQYIYVPVPQASLSRR